LHSRNFRYLWLGLIVSNAGTLMQGAAVYWLVLQLTGSTVALGLVSSTFALPMLILPLFGGTIADRHDRIAVLKFTQSSSMLLALVLAALTLTGAVQFWQILVINFLSALLLAVDNPTRQALLPDLVPPADLVSAASLNSAAFTGAALFGPALGGLLLEPIGPAGLFFLNGLSFLAVLAALFSLRGLPVHKRQGGAWWQNVVDGLRFIRAERLVLALVLLSAGLNFFANAGAYRPLMPVFARDYLQVGATGYGFMLAAPGAGALIGAFGLAWLGDFERRDLALVGGVVLAGLSLIAFGLWLFFPLSLVLLLINGVCTTGSAALIATSLQLRTPPRLRGRVMSLYTITVIGVGSLGGFASGAAAALLPPPLVVVLGAAIGIAIGVLLGPSLRGIRALGRRSGSAA
jgi:MFS family permease